MSGLQTQSDSGRVAGSVVLQRAVVVGFASAVAVWIAWFITHLPWVGMSEQASMPVLLAVWVLAAALAVAWTGKDRSIAIGLIGGVVCAVASLLILGSKIVPDATPSGTAAIGTRQALPSVSLIVPAFLMLGATIGLASSLLANIFPKLGTSPAHPLGQFSVVVAVGITPLLVVGGLVTSTNSGMAVPDWPNTYGSNMFLYPLGPRSAPGLYLEHSHRLFGTLVGLMTLVLTAWVFAEDRRRWVKALAIVALALVIAQGVLGGWRVLSGSEVAAQDNRLLAMLHGVLAQLVFGVVVALAAALSPLFTSPITLRRPPSVRRFKLFASALTHALIVQLIFGAMYRHLRSGHALWTHAGFSLVIVILAILTGFVAIGIARRDGGEGSPAGPAAGIPTLATTLRRIGIGLVFVVGLQFILGWVALMMGGSERTAASPIQALVRTSHQANGAVMIALAALAFVWARWTFRRATLPTDLQPASAA